MKHQKSKHRESLSDGAATIALQCRHYPDVVGDTASSTTTPLQYPNIDMDACFDYDYSSHHGDVHDDNSDVSSDD